MNRTFDPNFFTQIGLDSGALTMLGSVVHSFAEPGEYRGTVRLGDRSEATFYVSVDKSCAVAQVNIDLATLANRGGENDRCAEDGGRRFVVHPKGYAVFHVSGGAGGYWVNVRRAEDDPKLKAWDSREMEEGDIFSAILLRPGTYAIKNVLLKAQAEVTVSYPKVGETAYRPPPPVEVDSDKAFAPRSIRLGPTQGLNFHVKSRARIMIELTKADDGPRSRGKSTKAGRKKTGSRRT